MRRLAGLAGRQHITGLVGEADGSFVIVGGGVAVMRREPEIKRLARRRGIFERRKMLCR
jgi:hypothetical protein